MRRAIAAVALLLAACTREPRAKSFTLAAATSFQESGVLDVGQVEFKRDTGIEIHPIVTTSGMALEFASRHEADITITHDPAAERAFVARKAPKLYQEFMWNDFVIVGPPDDPADVAHAISAANAFRRINQTH